MCEHSEVAMGRMIFGLDLMTDGSYQLTVYAWRVNAQHIDEHTIYAGLTLPEAIVAIDGSSSKFYCDPF